MNYIESRLWAIAILIIGVMLPSSAWAEEGHQLTVVAKPAMAGSFNNNSDKLMKGETIHLYAYAHNGFTFVQWTDESGAVVSKQMDFVYTMPDRDVTLTAEYEYNPANPANPVRNYWNKDLGEVIVDDFTTGQLQSAVRAAIGNSNASGVTMITVAGIINNNDYGVLNTYSECTLFDMSRVTGVTQVPSYAFDYSKLEMVYLPATIEKIGYRAFYECKQLSSIILYAMTPPTLENNVFTGVPDGLIVYVPAAAIAQYQDAEGWKDFTFLPIQEDIRSISVSLPTGTKVADYANMWLELTNTKSGQKLHYVMTDRMLYTFSNIIRNTSWNVTLRNERGDEFGRIDNVNVKDEDVSVAFSSLSTPQNVLLSVLTPDGKNVTEQTQITWTDTQGNYVAQGTSLMGLPVGYQVNYRLALSQELAMAYSTPAATTYTLKDGGNNITQQLSPITQITLSGKVKDATTGLPLSGAVVSASQTFGGKYSKTLNAKTDNKGGYTLTVADVPTSLGIAANEYISQSITFENGLNGVSGLDDVSLKPISGATITVNLTYTTVEGETQDWYSDYQNVGYTLYNVTKKRAISQFNVQYPQIVLLEDVDDGDVLRLTATSRTNAFMPAESTATIAEQKTEATFNLVELGRLQVELSQTGNVNVAASLYDADGKLIKAEEYRDMSLTISNLTDGNYTLVSMGSSRIFNNVYDFSQLSQTGLKEGTDYVRNDVTIKSGEVTALNISLVPKFDESKLYYTGDNTSFTVNKPSIVVGNYLTLTGHIDFKPAYATNVSNVQLIVDLPESCSFVENSVMVGNSTSSYTLNGNQITIPMARYTDRVRFCVIPTLGGDYAPSAFAQFDLDGKTITQPIGNANYTAKDLSISVPSTVAKTSVLVSGTANGTSSVEIYDNGILIGQTKSLANGTWVTTCELNEPYNLSTHNIYAKVTTKAGTELVSETKQVMYDKNMVEAEKVTMLYYNPEFVGQYNIVFDLINNTVSPKSYYFFPYKSYPNWWGSGTEPKEFTFVADLSNNDSTAVNGVTICVYTDNGYWRNLEAQYNTSMNRWVAVSQFWEEEAPVGVEVEINSIITPQIEAAAITSVLTNVEETISDFETDMSSLSNLLDDFSNKLNNGIYIQDSLLLALSQEIEMPLNIDYERQVSDSDVEALLERCDSILKDGNIQSLTNLINTNIYELNSLSDYLNGITVTSCDNLSEEQLLRDGFTTIEKTDGSKLFILTTESVYEVVDFTANMHIRVSSETPLYARAFRANNNDSFAQQMMSGWEKLEFFCDKLYSTVRAFTGAIESIRSTLEASNSKLTQEIGDLFDDALYLQRNNGNKNLLGLLDAKIHAAVLTKQANTKIISWIDNNLKNFKVGKNFGKAFGVFVIIMDIRGAIQDMHQIVSLYKKCLPYLDDESNAISIQGSLKALGLASLVFYGAQLTSDIAAVVGAENGIFAAIPTGGSSLAAVGVSIGLVAANFIACQAYTKAFKNNINSQSIRINNLKCNKDKCPRCGKNPCECKDKCPRCGKAPCECKDKCPRCGKNPCECKDKCPRCGKNPCECKDKCPRCGQNPCVCPRPNNTTDVQHDPSGYVYEGVTSNRLQGVTASCYYKETVEDMYGDLHDNVVLWDAEKYAQENPLFTDEDGFYRWDVPKGLWQVKFEKEGYQTTYSEWLPVPPPQLEVNIAMTQLRQPTVKSGKAFADGVELEFDKYMMPELLTTENIMVMQGNKPVEGTVELLNEEVCYEGETETFASKIRFNAAKPFTAKEVTLIVNNRVKSYAGIRMQDNFQQTFAVEQEIKEIVCAEQTSVGYGETVTLTVSVLPASASKGKMLTVVSSSPMILGVETEKAMIGNDGKAEITFYGKLPGTAALTFSLEGTDKTAITTINVNQDAKVITSNIASGMVVDKGTEIVLSSTTEGAVIYYTLDGSSPSDNIAGRKVYDAPIVINDNTIIKAMVVASDMTESNVVEFSYYVYGTGIKDVSIDDFIDIYPLPVRDKMNVTAGGKMIKSIIISSMNGVVVESTAKTATKVTLDVSKIPTGIYIVSVTTEDGSYSRKVLKVH